MLSYSELSLFGLIAGLAPSPHTFYMLDEIGTPRGSRKALKIIAGGVMADLGIIILCALAASLIQRELILMKLFKVLGIFYMGYLARGLFQNSPQINLNSDLPHSDSSRVFLKSASIQMINPNPYFFWGLLFFAGSWIIDLNLILRMGYFLAWVYSLKALMAYCHVKFLNPVLRKVLFSCLIMIFLIRNI
jgi:threonine/homoserine/homoserine lactone efflux protein